MTAKLTERQQLKIARRLAVEAESDDVIEKWLSRREAMAVARGGDLVLPDAHADLEEIQARLRVRSLAVLEDIMLHSLNEDNQIKAAQLAAAITMGTASQPFAKPGSVMHAQVVENKPPALVEVTEDEEPLVHDLLVMRRKLQAAGGG